LGVRGGKGGYRGGKQDFGIFAFWDGWEGLFVGIFGKIEKK
jgi:hypothetical protein